MKHRIERYLLILNLIALTGCEENRAPSLIMAGAYFPAWMACAALGGSVAGIIITVLKQFDLILYLFRPFLFFFFTAVSAATGFWLLWYGR